MKLRRCAAGLLALALLAAIAPATPSAAPAAPAAPAKRKAAPAAAATIATVLGKPIVRADLGPAPPVLQQVAAGDPAKLKSLTARWEGQALTGLVLGTLLERYGVQRGIAATPAEVSEMMALAMKGATSPEAVKAGAPKPDTTDAKFRSAGAAVVERFKLHAALYDQYGGRVSIDPRMGPMPFDAYRSFLEAEQKAGAFTVATAWTKRFWAAFAEDGKQQYVPAAEASKVIHAAWWREDSAR